MQYDGIIATFGELFLKGRNRHRFIDQILRTVRRQLADFDQVTCEKTHAHLTITLHGTDPDAVLKKLGYVFGIQHFQLYTRTQSELDAIKQTTLDVARALEKEGRSIKVAVKRSDKQFPIQSPELASMLGRHVSANCNVPIDMATPDVRIRVIIQRNHTYVVSSERPALGGLPIGINGSSLLMLSGGLDSPVAGYLMMKRGLAVEALHFDSPPYTSPRARQKVFDLAEKMAHYMPEGKLRLTIIPFTDLQKSIFENVPESYGMTIMRRMMYRISEAVAQQLDCALIANGESLGQVASQTPQSMLAINCVITTPVIRPVACMDKTEIIDIARRIDTHDISIRPYEDCCTVFVPKSPSTAPKAFRCDEYEKRFKWEPLLDSCVKNMEHVLIHAGRPIQVDMDTSNEICALL
jgi:thiamine biosynthesis protein ThiI